MNNNIGQFIPDWTVFWTVAQAEEELPGFKFNGIGWYVTETEAILVTDISSDSTYRFSVYYPGKDVIETFKKISELPICNKK
jgi:hypothetical protein